MLGSVYAGLRKDWEKSLETQNDMQTAMMQAGRTENDGSPEAEKFKNAKMAANGRAKLVQDFENKYAADRAPVSPLSGIGALSGQTQAAPSGTRYVPGKVYPGPNGTKARYNADGSWTVL